uniref:Sulfhydryl oxidase n=1 Tax=Megaviridae environmental sample TaxID=1737588 RepID=A0A5J6VLB4_9VIRU|nr:MAG: Erv1 / Alr family protein [Megaviridae environmental sample]
MNSVFDKMNFDSPEGMLTSIWGPPLWHTLHTISFNYPVNPTHNDIENYYNFFTSLKNILPCKYCRDNLKKNLKKVRLNRSVFKNRDSLSRWVYNLHEEVNLMLNKNSGLSYNDIRDRYENFRARCVNTNKSIESGCTSSLYGLKGKCVMNIVPKNSSKESLKIDPKCKIKKSKK